MDIITYFRWWCLSHLFQLVGEVYFLFFNYSSCKKCCLRSCWRVSWLMLRRKHWIFLCKLFFINFICQFLKDDFRYLPSMWSSLSFLKTFKTQRAWDKQSSPDMEYENVKRWYSWLRKSYVAKQRQAIEEVLHNLQNYNGYRKTQELRWLARSFQCTIICWVGDYSWYRKL